MRAQREASVGVRRRALYSYSPWSRPCENVVGYGQSAVIGQSGVILAQFEWYRGAVFVSCFEMGAFLFFAGAAVVILKIIKKARFK